MLTALDETLRHQLPTTFDHAGTSDPRFFDRYWFAVYDPSGGEPVLNLGVCSYLNMNVVDGYAAVIKDGRQHNLRFSQGLRPELYTADPRVTVLGPLRVSIIEPYRRVLLELAPNAHGVAFELEWTAVLPPHEELPSFSRLRGRITQDYLRYNQSGTVDGWITMGGERFAVNRWWGGRDHSWGIRPDIAGGEPVTGDPDVPSVRSGILWSWLTFGAGDMGGHVQLQEVASGPVLHSEAMLRWVSGRQVSADTITLEFEVYPGTRRFARASYTLTVSAGEPPGVWRIAFNPISRSFTMLGLGYSMGYTDRRGFGIWRGAYHEECDVYDVSHDEDVVLPDGTVDRPYHRDCAVQVEVSAPDGTVTRGAGHCAILPIGSLPTRGIE